MHFDSIDIVPSRRPWLKVLVAIGVFGGAGCVSPQSPITQAGGDCPEFMAGATISDSISSNETVKVFLQASATFSGVTASIKESVKAACSGVATDLGAHDTWSSLGDDDKSISSSSGSGACDAAAARIKAIMEDGGAIDANFALVVTPGECHPDFSAQMQCDSDCDTNHTCTQGSVMTQCQPGQLTMKCDESCAANSFCEGTTSVAAQCSGACASTCSGHCQGACIAPDGTMTMDDPNCHGKCTDTCDGTCSGECKVTAASGISCGTDVRCKGSCTGSFTDPLCESTFTPANCTDNTECHQSCSAKTAANQVCEPSTVQLFANVNAVSNKEDVQKLVATINKNLPTLIDAAETKGPIAVDAVTKLSDAGQQVINASGNLDGHSLACVKVAAQADLTAAGSLKILNQAGMNVTSTCQSHAK